MLIVEVINRFAPHLLPWTVRFYETKGTGFAYDIGFYFGLVGSPVFAELAGRGAAPEPPPLLRVLTSNWSYP